MEKYNSPSLDEVYKDFKLAVKALSTLLSIKEHEAAMIIVGLDTHDIVPMPWTRIDEMEIALQERDVLIEKLQQEIEELERSCN